MLRIYFTTPHTMNILALDTSAEHCSVAIGKGNQTDYIESSLLGHYAENLLRLVHTLLHRNALKIKDMQGIAVGIGPGSFTALRLACGIAQGLAFALACPVVGIGSLHALALAAANKQMSIEGKYFCAIDARMNEIYYAVYTHDQGQWHTEVEPQVGSAATINLPQENNCIGVGNAFQIYSQVLQSKLSNFIEVHSEISPNALHVLALGKNALQQGLGVHASQLLPCYIRNKVATTMAERNSNVQIQSLNN